jgi:hypothetical protein
MIFAVVTFFNLEALPTLYFGSDSGFPQPVARQHAVKLATCNLQL